MEVVKSKVQGNILILVHTDFDEILSEDIPQAALGSYIFFIDERMYRESENHVQTWGWYIYFIEYFGNN